MPATIAADRAFDWQLDEQTCRVGRVGVAAARARLQSPSGRSTEAPTPPGGGRRAGPSAPARAEEVPAVEAA
ncbi:MAG TPA: hypothetical protein VEJ44_02110 [Acidimicrobiales bacterium]|nr:hypothetical protein [Acidimicrobiales bacterium]